MQNCSGKAPFSLRKGRFSFALHVFPDQYRSRRQFFPLTFSPSTAKQKTKQNRVRKTGSASFMGKPMFIWGRGKAPQEAVRQFPFYLPPQKPSAFPALRLLLQDLLHIPAAQCRVRRCPPEPASAFSPTFLFFCQQRKSIDHKEHLLSPADHAPIMSYFSLFANCKISGHAQCRML